MAPAPALQHAAGSGGGCCCGAYIVPRPPGGRPLSTAAQPLLLLLPALALLQWRQLLLLLLMPARQPPAALPLLQLLPGPGLRGPGACSRQEVAAATWGGTLQDMVQDMRQARPRLYCLFFCFGFLLLLLCRLLLLLQLWLCTRARQSVPCAWCLSRARGACAGVGVACC